MTFKKIILLLTIFTVTIGQVTSVEPPRKYHQLVVGTDDASTKWIKKTIVEKINQGYKVSHLEVVEKNYGESSRTYTNVIIIFDYTK